MTESTFNAAWAASPADPMHWDARLSDLGREQVRQARALVDRYPVELVLVSPLTRALQTAVGLFGDHPSAPSMRIVPLLREHYYLVCLKEALELPAIATLRRLLQSPEWQQHLAKLPGYRPWRSGEVLSLKAQLPWWKLPPKTRRRA
jgi:broad specificity phosphatase PhoE